MATARPYGPARVLKASKRLPWGYKAVWLEDYRLDNGSGSSASPAGMSELLGMSAETVTSYRERMQRWGLYRRIPRGRGLPDAWRPIIPERCHPAGDKVGREELVTLGGRLDDSLPRRVPGKGKADGGPVHKPDAGPVDEADSGPVATADCGPETGGVGGAVLPLTYPGEAQLRPVVTVPTNGDGVGASAPERPDGDDPDWEEKRRKWRLAAVRSTPEKAAGSA